MQIMADFKIKTDFPTARMIMATLVRCLRPADIKDMRDERREVTADCGD